jgi:hypothetical protein
MRTGETDLVAATAQAAIANAVREPHVGTDTAGAREGQRTVSQGNPQRHTTAEADEPQSASSHRASHVPQA